MVFIDYKIDENLVKTKNNKPNTTHIKNNHTS